MACCCAGRSPASSSNGTVADHVTLRALDLPQSSMDLMDVTLSGPPLKQLTSCTASLCLPFGHFLLKTRVTLRVFSPSCTSNVYFGIDQGFMLLFHQESHAGWVAGCAAAAGAGFAGKPDTKLLQAGFNSLEHCSLVHLSQTLCALSPSFLSILSI